MVHLKSPENARFFRRTPFIKTAIFIELAFGHKDKDVIEIGTDVQRVGRGFRKYFGEEHTSVDTVLRIRPSHNPTLARIHLVLQLCV